MFGRKLLRRGREGEIDWGGMSATRATTIQPLFSRDGEVPSQKELSSYFEKLFSSIQKELDSSN